MASETNAKSRSYNIIRLQLSAVRGAKKRVSVKTRTTHPFFFLNTRNQAHTYNEWRDNERINTVSLGGMIIPTAAESEVSGNLAWRAKKTQLISQLQSLQEEVEQIKAILTGGGMK